MRAKSNLVFLSSSLVCFQVRKAKHPKKRDIYFNCFCKMIRECILKGVLLTSLAKVLSNSAAKVITFHNITA